MISQRKKRIALFHPWIKSRGGAEKLILEFLKHTQHDVDVYTWIYDKEKTFEGFKNYSVTVVSPKFSSLFSRKILMRGLFFSLVAPFTRLPLDSYDSILISTSGVAELITLRNYKPGKTFAYVHTPLRETSAEDISWNLDKEYTNPLSRLLYLLSVRTYSLLEKLSWRRLDHIVFNSKLSLERAMERKIMHGKPHTIVHPPITFSSPKKDKQLESPYFLYMSRFSKRKRQDVLIKAWRLFVKSPQYAGQRLILVGSSEDARYFSKVLELAKHDSSIEIVTDASDTQVSGLIAGCEACIYIPFLEDFGMIPFEVLRFGAPLIASEKGGYVGLLEAGKHFRPVEEKSTEPEMIKHLVAVLEDFVSGSPAPRKKFSFRELSPQRFAKKLDDILSS